MLIGNKKDLSLEKLEKNPDDNSVVKKFDALAYARKNNLAFFETSAKSSENIEIAFNELLQEIDNVQSAKTQPSKVNHTIKIQRSEYKSALVQTETKPKKKKKVLLVHNNN